ncbi:MAG: excinuclease ABC subunit UvrC [Lachnospiraceae bacterium]|nr:excinuclease ABC subunit UvrC [Lachnospiraceae bacterium]
MFDIAEELKKLPNSPGVYLHHDSRDEIIYIGKAKNLKNRVSQYFQTYRVRSPKIEKMVSQISYFEYIVTDSEVEALVLENNLIKEHRPRYNTMLKDDKTYPYIKLTLSEEFPRLVLTRKIKKDADRYYGPYPNVGSVRDVIDLLNNVYHLRTCSKKLPRDIGKERPCLNYHLHKCDAPCAGFINSEDYGTKVKEVRRFLEGSSKEIVSHIKEEMMKASEAMEYEKAGEWKELLNDAIKIAENQKVEVKQGEDRDIIGMSREGFEAIIHVFFIRNGKLLDREHFYLSLAPEEADNEIISSFLKQYYAGSPYLPAEILVPTDVEDKAPIEQWLTAKSGKKVSILIPQKGKKEKMVELAEKNAKMAFDQDKEKVKLEEMRTKGAMTEISKMLGINYAKRVESFDISNISGYLSVGSMVVFEDGKPKKNDYRKFRIKTVVGANDFASMAEVLTRRLEHSEWSHPDMLLIDGGKGQVSAVKEAIEKMVKEGADERLLSIPICGMVKDDNHRTRGLLYEDREYVMDRTKEPFKLITRIQDETHRFAIEYHRQLRTKGQVKSILDDIPGIGPKRRLALIRYFKSIDAVKEADMEELLKVEGMNEKAAKSVMDFFAEESASAKE